MAEYCDSCVEYMAYIKSPRPDFDCSDWGNQFANWSAVQFWTQVVAGLIWVVWGLLNDCGCLGTMFSHFSVGIVTSYIFGHLGWFIVVRQHGCISPIVCVVVGILFLLHGVNWVHYAISGYFLVHYGIHLAPAMSHHWGAEGDLLRRIIYTIYGICLIYMGVAAIMICASGQSGGGYTSRATKRGLQHDDRDIEVDELPSARSDFSLDTRSEYSVEDEPLTGGRGRRDHH